MCERRRVQRVSPDGGGLLKRIKRIEWGLGQQPCRRGQLLHLAARDRVWSRRIGPVEIVSSLIKPAHPLLWRPPDRSRIGQRPQRSPEGVLVVLKQRPVDL